MPLIAALPVRRCLRLFALLLPLFAAARPALAADDDFLPVRSAYKVATSAEPGRTGRPLRHRDGYYLYRDRLGFESATPGVTLGKASLPVGLDHEDEFFGKQVIYRDTTKVGVPVTFSGAPQDFDVKVKLQGCADAGLCYPPQTWTVHVTWPKGVAGTPPVPAATAARRPAKSGGFNLRSLLGSGAKSDADFLLADQAFVLFDREHLARPRAAALGHRRRLLPLSRQGHGQDDRDRRAARQRVDPRRRDASTTSTSANRSSSTTRCSPTCRSSRRRA